MQAARGAWAAALLLLLPVGGRAQPPSWTVPVLELGLGRVSYEESPSTASIRSDWDADFVRLGGSVALVPEVNRGLYLSGTLRFDVSASEEETWVEGDGRVAQRNGMEWVRTDVRFDLGWFFHLNRAWVVPSAFLGTRFDHFNRSDFVLTGDVPQPSPGDVSEDLRLLLFGGALEGGCFLDPLRRWALEGRMAAGWIPLSVADNSLLGSVDGDGGSMLELALACSWHYTDHRRLLLGFQYGLQNLDGGVEVAPDASYFVEWPDNELDTMAFSLAWRAEL